ncbi:3-isopropylmalate dehydratase small subunit [Gimesia sp.]|uniref:3-isopropylmalate dehydratase small subunit n=1 Tax=Gimesia sp. TaxID=2024833 RepID=UPI000C6635C0|nr:3-isopropylmalate dehydratase small subunit [Gimesia sp.]MAX36390.1 3-isopropylmalate dehydratase small subunit [Gimesia sp.]HAH46697.1 3-isopropylmalate dehydratase small subunit [Planctomycetaceae bacterium]HBL47806.1 3-isopropylmalate dehydratase small subunit [Planctomycetaceae bacterium]|tara:strand:+ start:2849 stop:3439 length:591 start_codon:yes stop_codon:yes gene_type:complete
MNEVEKITGTGIPLLLDDIDTDRIIPARFLRCVTFEGLGEHAFEDDRIQDPEHPFDKPEYQEASILVGGRNFGCGSSREHAPQSLIRWGIQAIIAESYAEIFFGNCTSLGVPAVCASRQTLEALDKAIKQNAKQEITVDLKTMKIACGDQQFDCTLPENARSALISGTYDFLAQLLKSTSEIKERAAEVPYFTSFA